MGPEHSQDLNRISLGSEHLIDQLCDDFESACSSGERPDLMAFLNRAPEKLREQLLRELLASELECRAKAGETPQVDDYLPRLGETEPLVQEVFARFVPGRSAQDER